VIFIQIEQLTKAEKITTLKLKGVNTGKPSLRTIRKSGIGGKTRVAEIPISEL